MNCVRVDISLDVLKLKNTYPSYLLLSIMYQFSFYTPYDDLLRLVNLFSDAAI